MAEKSLESSSDPVATQRDGSQLRDRVRSLQLPPLERRASRNWQPLILGGIVLAVAAVGYQFRGSFLSSSSDASTSAPVVTKPNDAPTPTKSVKSAPITTPEAQPKAAAVSRKGIALESKGYIIPAHRILVSPKVSGMLVSLRIEEGMRVAKGEVLGQMETVDYQADLDAANAQLELNRERLRELEAGSRAAEIQQGEAELAEAKAKLSQVESDFKRARKLFQSGNTTQAEFDLADAEFQAQQQRVDRLSFVVALLREGPREERKAQARAEVKHAEAEVMKAKWRLENCTIRSTIGGTILKKNAEEGNIVNPIAQNGSFSLCEMADLSDLEAEMNIQERDIARVFVGQKCKVRTEAFPDRMYDGVVSRIMPFADRGKGALPVRVKITVPTEEEGVYLKPDMGAIVSFYGTSEENAK